MTISWETLGTVDPRRVVDARLQLHWAAQAASAPGRQLLEHQPDSSEQCLRWTGGPRALAQELVNGVWPFRSALRPSPPAVVLLDANDRVTGEILLDGHTLEEVYAWLEKEISRRVGRRLLQPLQRPGEGLPEHGVGPEENERFSVIDIAAFSEIGRWFGNAHRLLSEVADRHPGASAVRCWPHHFDIATLITLDVGADADADPEAARSIGVGLTPGDANRPYPYFYVTPWPYPKDRELSALDGGGVWNTEGWIGAVLETPSLLSAGPGEAQAEQAERFVEAAIAACQGLQNQDFAQTERSW